MFTPILGTGSETDRPRWEWEYRPIASDVTNEPEASELVSRK